ncbi:STAS domain-containing protein [Streptomyces seoulensis]|uniref:STAS domain-containing protein n=1 Tax=Streptomyces seoulensis TaxID=73044 RepID=UPI003C2EE29B
MAENSRSGSVSRCASGGHATRSPAGWAARRWPLARSRRVRAHLGVIGPLPSYRGLGRQVFDPLPVQLPAGRCHRCRRKPIGSWTPRPWARANLRGSDPRKAVLESADSLLRIQYTDRTVITVAGEIDLHACPALMDTTSVIPPDGKALHLEMSGVTFMDSSGLNHLLQLHLRLLVEGRQLVIAGLQDQPTQVLLLTGAYDALVTRSADTPGTASFGLA